MEPAIPSTELDTLLAHAGWVRRVATCLVRDASEADDLAQEVWLRALEERPATLENPRGWLAAVTRRVALGRARGAGRRKLRERAGARPERLPPTDQVVQEAEREREVAALVLALDEPYRSVLLLRFYRDLPPRRIASELGRPVATIKVQLQRGLELLRRRLDGRHGGREAWCLALLPLCARRVPLGLAAGLPLALLLSVGAVVRWWPEPQPRAPTPTRVTTLEPAQAESAVAVIERAPEAEPAREERVARAQEPATPPPAALADTRPTDWLRGRLLSLEGEPLAGIQVEAEDPRQLHWAAGDAETLVADNFWLPLGPARRDELLRSAEAREAFLTRHFPRGGVAALETRALLEGRALPRSTTWTDARGCFALEAQPGWRRIEIVDPGFDLVGWGVERETPAGREYAYFAGTSTQLEGRVLDARGNPCAGVNVELANGCPPEVSHRLALGNGLNCAQRETESDRDGRFRFERFPRSSDAWLSAELEGLATYEHVDLSGEEPPAPVTLRLELLPDPERPHVVGRLLRPDGTPAREGRVLLAGASASADEQGNFELVLVSTSVPGEVVAFEPGFDPLVEPELATGIRGPGRHALGTLRLPATRLVLAGLVTDARGTPLAEVELELTDARRVDGLDGGLEHAATGHARNERTDASGHFELRGLLPREYHLRIGPEHVFGPFQAGRSDLRLVLDER